MNDKSIKNSFPFRLGCTSYVYPDDILPNIRKMAPIVDDVEIVLFQSEEFSSFPDADTITELARLSKEYDITYTIHFPIDKKAGSIDESERFQFFDQVRKIIELTRPLNPYGYILHLEGIEFSASKQDIVKWRHACSGICENIAVIPELDCKKICIENLYYPIEWHMDLVKKHGFSLCCDVGHLWQVELNWKVLIKNFLPNIRIIHLHGVSDVKDHISLKNSKLDDVKMLIDLLMENNYHNVISLEVFNKEDTFESIEIVRELCQK